MKVDCTHCGTSNSFPGDFYDFRCKYCGAKNEYVPEQKVEEIEEIEETEEPKKEADVEFVMDTDFYKQLNEQGE